MIDSSCGEREWLKGFPFVDDFGVVCSQGFSWDDLSVVSASLRIAIDSMSVLEDVGRANVKLVQAVAYAVAAQQRCQVAFLYRDLVEDKMTVEQDIVVWMQETFSDSVERDGLIVTKVCPDVEAYLMAACSSTWVYYALAKLSTAEQLAKACLWSVQQHRWTVVAGFVTDYPGGRKWSELTEGELVLPVIPADVYREVVMTCMDGRQNSVTYGGRDISSAVVDSWIWLVRAQNHLNSGYCYLKWLHPAAWKVAVDELGCYPTVDAVVDYMGGSAVWSAYHSVCTVTTYLHVDSGGLMPCNVVDYMGMRVGGSPETGFGVCDPFAAALVDNFLKRHTDKPISPVTDKMDQLQQHEPNMTSSIQRTTLEISEMLHKFSGVALSPRSKVSEPYVGGRIDGHHARYDSDRLAELLQRLESGAVITEDYFSRLRSRLFRRKARPRLDNEGGRILHVFKNYGFDGGGSSSIWREDRNWDVIGWSSVVATVGSDQHVVIRFVAPDNNRDVRIDFTGTGDVDLKSVNVVTEGTVLWFTGSITFNLHAIDDVSLRASFPNDDGTWGLRPAVYRYLSIPGFSYYYCGYSMIRSSSYTAISMKLQPQQYTAFDVYKGVCNAAAGMVEYKLVTVRSSAPAKMVVASEPASALHAVRYRGVRFFTTQRDYISLLVVDPSEVFTVSVASACKLRVSIVQIVDEVSFDAYRDAGAYRAV